MAQYQLLGQRIKSLRIRKGLTQTELAKGVCTPSMISQIETERARPSYEILSGIANKLEVSVEHLLKDVHLSLERSSKFKMAQGMMRAGEYAAVIPLFEELSVNPGTTCTKTDILFELTTAYIETGEVQRATDLLDKILKSGEAQQNPLVQVRGYLLLGEAATRRKEYALALYHANRAMDEFSKVKKDDPHTKALILTKQAAIHQMMGKVTQAAALYTEALSLSQENGTPEERGRMFLQLAQGFYKQKNFEKAEEFSSKALILFELVDAEGTVNDWKRKLTLLRQREQQWLVTVEQLLSIATSYEERKDKARAGETYADIAAIFLENSEGDQNKLAEAWAYAEKAMLILPHNHPALGKAHQVLSFVYFERGHEESGRKHYTNAVAVFEQNEMLAELEEISMRMSRFLDAQGRGEEAFGLINHIHNVMVQKLQERGVVL